MYRGKHCKKTRGRSRKSAALLVSFLLLLAVTVGGTIAFLTDSAGPIVNLFNPSKVTTSVGETLDGTIKRDVKIQNTGDTDAWIRASVVITWQDAEGNVYGQAPIAGTDYAITYNVDENKTDTTKWYLGNDGFYYWPSPVVAETGETGVLINSCTTDKSIIVGSGEDAVTYYLTVEILGSGIQSKPAEVFNERWARSGLSVDGSDADPMQWKLVD